MLKDYTQSLTNVDILGQGNLNLVSEKSGKSQGIILSIICGNPAHSKSDYVSYYTMEANCVEMARFHISSVGIKAFIPLQCSKLKDNLLQ